MAVDPGWRPVVLGVRLVWRRAHPSPAPTFEGRTPLGEVQVFRNRKAGWWEFRLWPRGWRGVALTLDGFPSADRAAEAGDRALRLIVDAVKGADPQLELGAGVLLERRAG